MSGVREGSARIETEAELLAAPVGTVMRDRMNDVWVKVSESGANLAGEAGVWGPTWVSYPADVLTVVRVVESGALDLDAIEARADAAMMGPWGLRGIEVVCVSRHTGVADLPWVADIDPVTADGAFIAAARSDVPALVARVRELEAALAAAQASQARCIAQNARLSDQVKTWGKFAIASGHTGFGLGYERAISDALRSGARGISGLTEARAALAHPLAAALEEVALAGGEPAADAANPDELGKRAVALLSDHTREMVQSGMGYALARAATEPEWVRSLDKSGTVHDAVAPAATDFMEHRGSFAVQSLAADLVTALREDRS